MGLLSIFQRKAASPSAKPVSDGQDAVQVLRVRARRRLIGAAILVLIGVIGFPLVFETRPRPIPVDLPIEIPRKEGAAPLVIPPVPVKATVPEPVTVVGADAPAETASRSAPMAAVQTQPPGPAKGEIITEDRDGHPLPSTERKLAEKPHERAADKPPARTAEKPLDKTSEKVAEKSAEKTTDRAAEKAMADKLAQEKQAKAREAARVQALLDGQAVPATASASSSQRTIVQVGAYADGKAAQETRLKVERLGLKTYTQAVDTPEGKRIRVRVGPFANRDEALKAAEKLKSHGLGGNVLTL